LIKVVVLFILIIYSMRYTCVFKFVVRIISLESMWLNG